MMGARTHLFIACVFAASGVGLWAYATHGGYGSAAIAAQMLLIHAAALVGLTAVRTQGLMADKAGFWLASALALGVALFGADLALRSIAGARLFAMASPLGGMLMMGAWLGLGVTALLTRRR
jgi:uncharacterized membrane protein YgdD (TMEM256/DUF423 family)